MVICTGEIRINEFFSQSAVYPGRGTRPGPGCGKLFEKFYDMHTDMETDC